MPGTDGTSRKTKELPAGNSTMRRTTLVLLIVALLSFTAAKPCTNKKSDRKCARKKQKGKCEKKKVKNKKCRLACGACLDKVPSAEITYMWTTLVRRRSWPISSLPAIHRSRARTCLACS